MARPSEAPEDFKPCLSPVPFYLDIPVEKHFRGPLSSLYAAYLPLEGTSAPQMQTLTH